MDRNYKPDDFVAVHQTPIWRDRANFVIRAMLEEKDGQIEWEQLWALRLDERRFLICCIPFFAYGLALGDEAETDEYFVVQQVLKSSRHYTFRIWFGNSTNSEIKGEVQKTIEKFQTYIEWSSENLLAVSVENTDAAEHLMDYLQMCQDKDDLIFETGKLGTE